LIYINLVPILYFNLLGEDPVLEISGLGGEWEIQLWLALSFILDPRCMTQFLISSFQHPQYWLSNPYPFS